MTQEKQSKAKLKKNLNKPKIKKYKRKPKQQSGALKLKVKPLSQKRHKARRAGNRIFIYDPSSKDKVEFKKQCYGFVPKFPLEGAISVSMVFTMPRPKSHYRSGKYSHILKDNAPMVHVSKPDIDNLIKFYLDAMTGSFWKDDCTICTIEASKIYNEECMVEIEYWNSPE